MASSRAVRVSRGRSQTAPASRGRVEPACCARRVALVLRQGWFGGIYPPVEAGLPLDVGAGVAGGDAEVTNGGPPEAEGLDRGGAGDAVDLAGDVLLDF